MNTHDRQLYDAHRKDLWWMLDAIIDQMETEDGKDAIRALMHDKYYLEKCKDDGGVF